MREIVRPSLHFTPQKGWINDPNGLVFLKDNIIYFISIIRTMIAGTVCTGACGKPGPDTLGRIGTGTGPRYAL